MRSTRGSAASGRSRTHSRRRKKNGGGVQREVTREVDQLLGTIFNGQRQIGRLEMEAIEMVVRSAMASGAGNGLMLAVGIFSPAADRRTVACACGHSADYQELRSKSVLTAVGRVEVSRPYYLCPHCHNGRFPADIELDIENLELSPGVRRMQAAVGQDRPFDHGRQQLKLLADLEVTTKSVERTAEAIGGILRRVSRQRSGAPSNWICRSCWANRFRSCMCKWMGLEFRS